MNKFYMISIIIHGLVIASALALANLKKEEVKFVPKRTMTISLENKRARSDNKEVSVSKVEPVVEEKKEEETKKEVKEEKKIEEKKIEKKKILKPKKKINKKIIKQKKQKVQQKKKEYNEFQDKNRFALGADGVFTAIRSDGIEYEILREVDPKYPALARKMRYNGNGSVTVKFIVNLNGKVENISFVSGETKFGFKEEVFKALKHWKFKPIVLKGQKIKVVFEKNFTFRVN